MLKKLDTMALNDYGDIEMMLNEFAASYDMYRSASGTELAEDTKKAFLLAAICLRTTEYPRGMKARIPKKTNSRPEEQRGDGQPLNGWR